MNKKPIRHLHFKLLKENVVEFEHALEDSNALESYVIKDGFGFEGALFVARPKQGKPQWFEFIQSGTKEKIDKLTNKSNSAILLIKHKKRIFALPFGHGRHLLNDSATVNDFGIKAALNALQHDSIRSVDTFSFEEQTVQKRTQASKVSGLEVFGLDVSRDILRSVTGKTREDIPFENVSGKEDTIALSVQAEFKDLKWICDKLLDIYDMTYYKKHFSWVDNVKRVTTQDIIDNLDKKLVDELNLSNPNLHLAPPEPIEWDKFYYYSFTRAKHNFSSDIDISVYKETLSAKELSTDVLKHDKIYAYSDDKVTIEYNWPAYKCIVFETSIAGHTYVLSNGEWFEIEKSFSNRIKSRMTQIPISTISLPKVNRIDDETLEHEGDYNERVARKDKNIFLFDKKCVKCENASTPIEVCDLFTKDRHFIHVKHRSGGSSAFSHLFSQGRVSAEALMADKTYRQEIRNKLKPKGTEWVNVVPLQRPRPSLYSIVFAFLGTPSSNLAKGLPFFSQLTLMRIYDDLTSRQFKVEILGIDKSK